jgi:hypothetical protein
MMRDRLTALAFVALTIATGLSSASLMTTASSAASANPGLADHQKEVVK